MEKPRALDAEIIYQSPRLSNVKTSSAITSDNVYRPCPGSCGRKRDRPSRNCRCDCECEYQVCYCEECAKQRCHYKSSNQQCSYENVDEIPVRDEECYTLKRTPDNIDDGSEGDTDRDKFIPRGELFTVFEGDQSEATIRTTSLETQESTKEKQSVESQTDSETDHEDLIKILVKSILEKLKDKRSCKQDFDEFGGLNQEKCRYIVERLYQAIGENTSYTDESTSKEEILASYNYSEKAIHPKSDSKTSNAVQPKERNTIPLADRNAIALNDRNVVAFNDKNKIEINDRAEEAPDDKSKPAPTETKLNEISANNTQTYQNIVEELLNKCIEHDKVREISCTIEHLGPDKASEFNTNSQIHSTVKVRMLKNPNFEYDNRWNRKRNNASSDNALKTGRQLEDSRKIHSENDVYSTSRGEYRNNDVCKRSDIKRSDEEQWKLQEPKAERKERKNRTKQTTKREEYIAMMEDSARDVKRQESKMKRLHIEDSTNFVKKGFCATLCMCLCRMLGKNC